MASTHLTQSLYLETIQFGKSFLLPSSLKLNLREHAVSWETCSLQRQSRHIINRIQCGYDGRRRALHIGETVKRLRSSSSGTLQGLAWKWAVGRGREGQFPWGGLRLGLRRRLSLRGDRAVPCRASHLPCGLRFHSNRMPEKNVFFSHSCCISLLIL